MSGDQHNPLRKEVTQQAAELKMGQLSQQGRLLEALQRMYKDYHPAQRLAKASIEALRMQDMADTMMERLACLKVAIDCDSQLLQYVLPKLKAIEVKIEDERPALSTDELALRATALVELARARGLAEASDEQSVVPAARTADPGALQ